MGVPVYIGKKEDSYHKPWKCQTCNDSKSRGGTAAKQDLHADFPCVLAETSKNLRALPAVSETVDHIEQSMQLMLGKYADVLRHIEEQNGATHELKKWVDKVQQEKMDQGSMQLRLDEEELEFRNTIPHLVVHGI